MRAFTIPVAFLVEGVDEADAAARLVSRIEQTIGNGDPIPDGGEAGAVESWWLPNNPPFTHGGDLDMPRLHWSDGSTTHFLMDGITNEHNQPNVPVEKIDSFLHGVHQSAWDTLQIWTEALEEDMFNAGFIKYEDEDDE